MWAVTRLCAQVLGAVTRALSAVLAHMDRSSGLRLLGEGSTLFHVWADLFKVTLWLPPMILLACISCYIFLRCHATIRVSSRQSPPHLSTHRLCNTRQLRSLVRQTLLLTITSKKVAGRLLGRLIGHVTISCIFAHSRTVDLKRRDSGFHQIYHSYVQPALGNDSDTLPSPKRQIHRYLSLMIVPSR